jgi:hypothetical protein
LATSLFENLTGQADYDGSHRLQGAVVRCGEGKSRTAAHDTVDTISLPRVVAARRERGNLGPFFRDGASRPGNTRPGPSFSGNNIQKNSQTERIGCGLNGRAAPPGQCNDDFRNQAEFFV